MYFPVEIFLPMCFNRAKRHGELFSESGKNGDRKARSRDGGISLGHDFAFRTGGGKRSWSG
jgi:hypothetical protein